MIQSRDPRSAARKILKTLNVKDLNGLPLKDVVQSFGPYVKEDPMVGAQGRILFIGSLALITVNSNIRHRSQARFVLAHEFGHSELHSKIKPIFNCDEDSFKQWLKKGEQEQEANEFAAELLMPSKVFSEECVGQDFSLDLVAHLADRFQTSQTATALRLIEQGPFPIAIVYSEGKKIKWFAKNRTFPLGHVVIGAETPPESAARHWFDTSMSKQKVMDSWAWFFNDYKRTSFSRQRVREFVLPLPSYNGVLSFLRLE